MPATTAANRQLPQAIDVLASPLFFSVSTKGEIAGTGFISARYSANTGGPNYTLQKARGTIAAPADAIAGDTAFNLLAQAYDAGAFRTIANLAGRCAIGFGGGDSPGLWAFQTTPVGSYTQRDVVLFDSAGNVQFVVDGTLNAAAVDAVSLVGVDRINTRHAAAANRVLAFQSERGSPIYLGDDALDFAATTGVVSVNGTDLLSMTSTAATLAGNLFITGTLPYVDVKPSGWASSGYIQFGVSPSFAASGNYGGLYVPAGKGIAFTQAGTTLFLMDVGGNVGLGVGSTAPLAKFESRATSGAQIIASFDASNHFSTTVSSLGAVTFDATGESAGFTFSDAVTATSLACPTFTTASGAMTFTPASNASFTIASTEFRSGAFSAEKTLQLPVFANAVAHQKIDLYMTGTQALWGALEVEVADSYSYVLAAGVVRRRFYLGISNTIYTNESRYDDDGGATGDVWAISPLRWDATNSRYYITIVHRDSNGSMPLVRMRFLGTSSAFVDNFQTFTLGSVYTTDTTVYDRPRISFSGNVGIGTTTPTSALSVVGVIKMEASSQRRPALTSSNFGYSANYRTLMLGSSSTTYNTADTGAVTIAFGVDVSANTSGSFTGNGSELLFRNITHFITPNSGNTNYQKVMTFNDSNVGIGTTSPQSKLQVTATETVASAGVVQIGGGASAAYGVLVDYAALNSGRCSITQLNNSGGSAATIALGFGAISSGFPTNNVLTLNQSGNVGLGVIAFGTSATKVLGIGNGTEPTTSPADMIQLYSVDLSAGNATLGLRTETAVVTESVTSDRTLSVRINGTTYKICLKA